jgi:hypothetical protein
MVWDYPDTFSLGEMNGAAMNVIVPARMHTSFVVSLDLLLFVIQIRQSHAGRQFGHQVCALALQIAGVFV